MAEAGERIDTATVLFTDLVGSTAQRSRIGEEAADVLRVKHDALITDAITAHRGTVVKHTGDGAMATFSAAVDAVAAAVAIQQAVDGHNRRGTDERMEVRVGISVGDVTFSGDDCFGLPVIEAQRLEAAADGGQILCAEIVRHLARADAAGTSSRAWAISTSRGSPTPSRRSWCAGSRSCRSRCRARRRCRRCWRRPPRSISPDVGASSTSSSTRGRRAPSHVARSS